MKTKEQSSWELAEKNRRKLDQKMSFLQALEWNAKSLKLAKLFKTAKRRKKLVG